MYFRIRRKLNKGVLSSTYASFKPCGICVAKEVALFLELYPTYMTTCSRQYIEYVEGIKEELP